MFFTIAFGYQFIERANVNPNAISNPNADYWQQFKRTKERERATEKNQHAIEEWSSSAPWCFSWKSIFRVRLNLHVNCFDPDFGTLYLHRREVLFQVVKCAHRASWNERSIRFESIGLFTKVRFYCCFPYWACDLSIFALTHNREFAKTKFHLVCPKLLE